MSGKGRLREQVLYGAILITGAMVLSRMRVFMCARMTKGLKKSEKDNVMCPDAQGNEGTCDADLTAQNADTYSFVAAGVFFSAQCGRDIPLSGPPAPAKRRLAERQTSCPAESDMIFYDGVNPIGAYVHFGDSYGAGMGTGTTSTDKCRVGSNNFGRLIYAWMNDTNIEHVEKVCSGDTLRGLADKINSWSDPGKASIGTLFIGGNDIGSFDLIYYCVTTPNEYWTLPNWNKGYCQQAKQKALDYMADTSDSGLQHKLTLAYTSIVQEAGVGSWFFNPVGTDCDWTTCRYINPQGQEDPWMRGSAMVWLEEKFRAEMNDLVDKLNQVIARAVSDTNARRGAHQVHYVDVAHSFNNGHRWCENPNGEFHEPQESRDDTWFFLSA